MDNVVEYITRRERQILVHSILYYSMNESILADRLFDMISLELVALMEGFPNKFKQTELYKDFKTFDGTTGYDLPLEHSKYVVRARCLKNLIIQSNVNVVQAIDFYRGYKPYRYDKWGKGFSYLPTKGDII